jgi:hypothetical protein
MGYTRKAWLGKLAVLLCALGLTGLSVSGAYGAGEAGGWKWKAEASVGVAYDTNVYKLSSTQSDRFDLNLAKDQTTGRYKDMDSIDDIIFTPRLKATFRRPGFNGRDLSIKPSIAYNRYVWNQERSYFDFGLGVNQALGKHSGLGVSFGYAPNIFKKNYLSGATDQDNAPSTGISTTVINGTEKVFSAAHYDKTDVTLYYSTRLWKSANKNPANLALETVSGKVLVGYENKNYDDPFTNRTEDSIFAGFDLDLALYKNTTLTLSYLFKNIDTAVEPEILIRNETNFGVDLNGDGDALDLSVATNQTVDRSRHQNTIGARVSTRLQNGWNAYARYEVRFTSYKSEETFDVTRLDRNDTRQKVGAGLKGEIAPRWTMALDWTLLHNAAARDGLALVDKTEAKSMTRTSSPR